MKNVIQQIDEQILFLINGCYHPLIDMIMKLLSDRLIWFPFYAFILYWAFRKGIRPFIWYIFSIVILILIIDQSIHWIIKPLTERIRPCHESSIREFLCIIDSCGGKYSFFSAHAANSFAFAGFIFLSTKKYSKWIGLLFIWAFFVALSRVYLGVHYPSDVLVGALYGMCMAYFAILILKKINKLQH